jgi:hypothetical protein
LFVHDRNGVRGAVLGLSQDGACTDLFEDLGVNSLKGDLSNDDTTFKPPLFSLVNTFNVSCFGPFYLPPPPPHEPHPTSKTPYND